MYNQQYFKSVELNADFNHIAETLIKLYQPRKVIEFGCGAGHLSRSLASRGVEVTALDGYSDPNFSGYNVQFYKLDLNNTQLIAKFVNEKKQAFDLAICLEVAEHLLPQTSENLIRWLTHSAPVVIFSAAVPEQGGTGHINCRNRQFWHALFLQQGFRLMDKVRSHLRNYADVAPWYAFNTLDYVQMKPGTSYNEEEVIARMMESESAVASEFYRQMDVIKYLTYRLHLKPVQIALKLRNFAKRIVGKPALK